MPGYPQWFSCALQDISRASPQPPRRYSSALAVSRPEMSPPKIFPISGISKCVPVLSVEAWLLWGLSGLRNLARELKRADEFPHSIKRSGMLVSHLFESMISWGLPWICPRSGAFLETRPFFPDPGNLCRRQAMRINAPDEDGTKWGPKSFRAICYVVQGLNV